MLSITPSKEVADIIKEQGGDALKLCYQCGICTATCPWNMVKNFPLRSFIHQAQLGLIDFEDEQIWQCVSCKHCSFHCPRGVKIPDIMKALRVIVMDVGAGVVPHSLRVAVKNLSAVGNPLGEPVETRTDWTKDLDVRTFTNDMEILFFPCCYQEYDRSHQLVIRAAVNILKKAGVNFGILDSNHVCCGESLRKSGAESLYHTLAQKNINIFNRENVKTIVVTSPHCYQTFKEEYSKLGGSFEVLHVIQYIEKLINSGKIKIHKKLHKKVTFHDSCCFGRPGMYEEPRRLLKLLGCDFIEMEDSHENALCCGGCAGRLWMDTKKGERFSNIRIEQAIKTGASILAINCPYCRLNFHDSILTLEKENVIQLKDIVELVEEAI